ncbi:MAG: hypothetical protein ABSG19_09195 [Candidatus Aminicenantales bacterium]
MIKRGCAVVLFFLALAPAPAWPGPVLAGPVRGGDWKAEFLTYLGAKPDFRGALEFLTEKAKSMEEADRQTAAALLPYLAWKTGDAAGERDLVSDYFEKYLDNDPEFGFLDDFSLRDFLTFWERWRSRYPLVSAVNFLYSPASAGSALPAGIQIGVDLMSDAYYKISLGPYNLEGGFWPRGFHIMTVPVDGLFERSGTYDFTLDLKAAAGPTSPGPGKAEDIVVRKPIRIAVDLSAVASTRAPETVLPEVRIPTKPAQASRALPGPAPGAPALNGELSLYVDGKLIMRSRKIAAKAPPINIPLGGPSVMGTKPYLPPPTTDPMANSVSILDAIAVTYKVLKDLLTKKPPVPSPPSYQKVTSLTFSFTKAGADGTLSEARAVVRLENARAIVLRK